MSESMNPCRLCGSTLLFKQETITCASIILLRITLYALSVAMRAELTSLLTKLLLTGTT